MSFESPNPTNLSSIPVLDYSLLSSSITRPLFISQLQDALINVGFLYLANHPVPASTIDPLTGYIPQLFDLPQDEKDRFWMMHSPHFLGYSGPGAELTSGQVDHKEQFDIGSKYETKWTQDTPIHWRVYGLPQWPAESALPGFRETTERYVTQVTQLSNILLSLVAEAFDLPPTAFDKFFGKEVQHRAKMIKYPAPEIHSDQQGMGPHYDGGFLTFLLQASSHRGLQVQNLAGEWEDVPPIPGTFVVNIGKALEFVTQGLARATSHRVIISRRPPSSLSDPTVQDTPRYSVPFFQSLGLDVRVADNVLEIPPNVLKLKERRRMVGQTESVNLAEYDREPAGMVLLISRIKSHPDVAQKHYPELFMKYFPNGLPSTGSAY